MWKGEIAPEEQFFLFSTIFSIYLLTSGVKLHIHLLNVVVRFIVFVNITNLICRRMDISKYSREFLGLQDNESRLYHLMKFLPSMLRAVWILRVNKVYLFSERRKKYELQKKENPKAHIPEPWPAVCILLYGPH